MIALAHAGMTALTWLFLIGFGGSLLVVAMSFVDDLIVLIGRD